MLSPRKKAAAAMPTPMIARISAYSAALAPSVARARLRRTVILATAAKRGATDLRLPVPFTGQQPVELAVADVQTAISLPVDFSDSPIFPPR